MTRNTKNFKNTKSIEARVQEAAKFATEQIASFMFDGFFFNPTMRASQGEELKVDVTNGMCTYRVIVLRKYEEFEEKVYCRVMRFETGFDSSYNTLWNDDGKILVNQEF